MYIVFGLVLANNEEDKQTANQPEQHAQMLLS